MEKEYRYMIWNDLKKEYQFANICEPTEKGAIKCLFNTIGNDARKYRFVVQKIEKERAIEIRRKLKYSFKKNLSIYSLIVTFSIV